MLGIAVKVGVAAEVFDEMNAFAAGEPQVGLAGVGGDARAQNDLELSITRWAAGRRSGIDA